MGGLASVEFSERPLELEGPHGLPRLCRLEVMLERMARLEDWSPGPGGLRWTQRNAFSVEEC